MLVVEPTARGMRYSRVHLMSVLTGTRRTIIYFDKERRRGRAYASCLYVAEIDKEREHQNVAALKCGVIGYEEGERNIFFVKSKPTSALLQRECISLTSRYQAALLSAK